MFTNSYGFCGLTELGGLMVLLGLSAIGVILGVIAFDIQSQIPVSESHPEFAGIDCELMRSYITYNTEAHAHHLAIYTEKCL